MLYSSWSGTMTFTCSYYKRKTYKSNFLLKKLGCQVQLVVFLRSDFMFYQVIINNSIKELPKT